ncbi:hypothetical protein IFM12275_23610 [Nocardia sputorum]|uniref:hypothetical protein n=1 Tax=Nocardia sputorum TaxID=2984338 RepID=UPI002492EE08|nr:hypothetical protein [Nocardia sputorum]BDT92385.1 hypothetical protein IFM12275_23610 [Nocardia sputorum]
MSNPLSSETPALQAARHQIHSHANDLNGHRLSVQTVEQDVRGASAGLSSTALAGVLVELSASLDKLIEETRTTADNLGTAGAQIESSDEYGQATVASTVNLDF